MTRVSLKRCHEYSNELIRGLMLEGMRDIGFDPALLSGKRVVLKPNILSPAPEEKAIITHPEFFRAAVRIVKDNAGIPILAESPAMASLEKAIRKTGYREVVDEEGVEVADVSDIAVILHEGNRRFKRFEISKAFADADVIVNLPKLKTHGITYLTCAVKNLFGTIPGMQKSRWHMKAPTPKEFTDLLLDLNEALLKGLEHPKRFLHLVDAVVGQEGEGPGPAGTPRKIGALICGEDPIAVDYVAAVLLGLDPNRVTTVAAGFARDFGVRSPAEIEIVGEKIEDMKVRGFVPTRGTIFSNVMRGPLTSRWVRNLFTEKPAPDEQKCTLCLECKKICPAGAIEKPFGKLKVPRYDYDKCIRCYCCMEICPEGAISLRRGPLQWMMWR